MTANETLIQTLPKGMYPLMEQFYTLQGEGAYTGNAAYFIRLGGCDVGCVWCDVKESWDARQHTLVNAREIVSVASTYNSRLAVITGGEPAMFSLVALADALHEEGFRVHIETSGAYTLQGDLDWVTISPKKFKPALDETLLLANELKVVIYHKTDLAWAEQFVSRVPAQCKLYLQPEWSKKEEMTPMLTKYIMKHPQWQLSLQTHKYIHIP